MCGWMWLLDSGSGALKGGWCVRAGSSPTLAVGEQALVSAQGTALGSTAPKPQFYPYPGGLRYENYRMSSW
jgi:hypothetical protein